MMVGVSTRHEDEEEFGTTPASCCIVHNRITAMKMQAFAQRNR